MEPPAHTGPPFDAALLPMVQFFASQPEPSPDRAIRLESGRERVRLELSEPTERALRADPELSIEERTVPGPRGQVPILIVRPASSTTATSKAPGVFHIHGGGMNRCNYWFGMDGFVDSVKKVGLVVISVEYGLAPENSGLGLVEDCYAALTWIGANLESLGIREDRLVVAGGSAGGGLAAGTALMARDRGGPKLWAQMLLCPMLDDRNNTVSCDQFRTSGFYTTTENIFSWDCVLGDRAGAEDGVSPYIAPARATDLSRLPQAYIDVGSSEPFRDEDVEYASKLWAAGVQAELHVWPGGFHGFTVFAPDIEITKGCHHARAAWLRRMLE